MLPRFVAPLFCVLLAGTAVADDRGVATGGFLRPFNGRSGATAERSVVTGCGLPMSESARGLSVLGGAVSPPAAGKIDLRPDSAMQKRFYELTVKWYKMTPEERKKALDEALRDLPPKYHEAIKNYLEMLAKLQEEKK